MIDDDTPDSLFAGSGGSAAAGLVPRLGKEDLDPLSVEDLKGRIAALEAEIIRVRAAIESKQNRRSAADALFSFKGN